MNTYIPNTIQEWVKDNPILAAILALTLLAAVVIFAIRYGDLQGPW